MELQEEVNKVQKPIFDADQLDVDGIPKDHNAYNRAVHDYIGEHYQVYLEGWRVQPRKIPIVHDKKEYRMGTQAENLALMSLHQEDPKRLEILDWHFKDYLSQIFRVRDSYENDEKGGITKPMLSKRDQYADDGQHDEPAIVEMDDEYEGGGDSNAINASEVVAEEEKEQRPYDVWVDGTDL